MAKLVLLSIVIFIIEVIVALPPIEYEDILEPQNLQHMFNIGRWYPYVSTDVSLFAIFCFLFVLKPCQFNLHILIGFLFK